jgi:hypothetical protein
MKMSSYDVWATSGPEWQPTYFKFDFDTIQDENSNIHWELSHTVEDGKCTECDQECGQCWWIKDDVDVCNWKPYLQIDEDGEDLLCEECYEEMLKSEQELLLRESELA